MKQEDKELLIKDLCSRLPYGVKFKHKDWDVPLGLTRIYKSAKYGTFIINERIFEDDLDEIKPYLRSMSSMTKEERKEYEGFIIHREHVNAQGQEWYIACFSFNSVPRFIDWLNKHHFDYLGFIEKGLALEAPKDMYK